MPKDPKSHEKREHETDGFTISQRDISWDFVIAFFLGSIIGQFTPDGMSDLLFFLRASQAPLQGPEAEFYWYYLPSLIYVVWFIAAVLIMAIHHTSARWYMVAFTIFVSAMIALTLRFVLGFTILNVILMVIPLIVLIFLIFFKITVRYHGRKFDF